MHAWELDLATRSTDRVVRPFDWGMEWTKGWPFHSAEPRPEARLLALNRMALKHSAEFFAYRPPHDFRLQEDAWLKFTSAVETPYPQNNTVHARYFPANPRLKRGPKAVVVLPHWNASSGSMRRSAQGSPSWGFRRCGSACPITISGCLPN